MRLWAGLSHVFSSRQCCIRQGSRSTFLVPCNQLPVASFICSSVSAKRRQSFHVMRLINTTTEQFEEFFDTQLPQYAILSHRWGRGEISHQDYLDGGMSGDSNLATQGRTKIDNCVCFARERGLEWVWIDTCCIDKKSSAELTEAINSMYSWYAQATECYALLSDVPSKDDASPEQRDRAFRHSAWFSRGWYDTDGWNHSYEMCADPSAHYLVGRSRNCSRPVSSSLWTRHGMP